jgi:molybdate transport system regulatory protein
MRKSSSNSIPSLILRIYLDAQEHIGHGKIELLENIRSCGSISAAGRAMNMSYRHAWDLVDQMNRTCGCAVVETQEGGKSGGGARLTPFGASLIARYRQIERSVEIATRKELLALRADLGKGAI